MKTARTFLGTELALNMRRVREDALHIQAENDREYAEASAQGIFGQLDTGDVFTEPGAPSFKDDDK
jgi:hypothetical protein